VAAEQFGRANAGVLQNGGRIIDARCDDHPVSCGGRRAVGPNPGNARGWIHI
jgi:hypothetical protein